MKETVGMDANELDNSLISVDSQSDQQLLMDQDLHINNLLIITEYSLPSGMGILHKSGRLRVLCYRWDVIIIYHKL